MSSMVTSENQSITRPLRDTVQKLGLLTVIRNLRGALRRDVQNWIRSGCPSPAPNIVKFHVVRHHVVSSGNRVFIETGTYLGSMLEYIATTGVQCHSIEIDPQIHARAKSILGHR